MPGGRVGPTPMALSIKVIVASPASRPLSHEIGNAPA